ncbi:MAG: hypothetical protein D6689_13245 [Deltaproteobacteria bacterium]|nr:MAG: hypothetical protein D6689_13245 [Deltaproteobacteria bacterium]
MTRGQRGSAMVVVLILLVALLGAGGVAIYVQLADTRSTGLIRQARDALSCAEAGLAEGRVWAGQNYGLWAAILDGDPSNDPSNYPLRGDIDGDGNDDWEVQLMDNDDEMPPAANDTTRDNDLRVFVVARCIRYPTTPREVIELVRYEGGGAIYRNQSGQGSGNTNNAN